MPLISVAVPVPFLDELTYEVPAGVQVPPVGARVRVPLGSRTLTGCVVGHDVDAASLGGATAKAIAATIDESPFVPAPVVELASWVAEYYLAGIGDALSVAMPPGARTRASGFKTRLVARLGSNSNQIAVTFESDSALTPKQRMALDVLEGTSGLPLEIGRAHV